LSFVSAESSAMLRLNSRDPLLLIRLGEEHVEYFKPFGLPLPFPQSNDGGLLICATWMILCENSLPQGL